MWKVSQPITARIADGDPDFALGIKTKYSTVPRFKKRSIKKFYSIRLIYLIAIVKLSIWLIFVFKSCNNHVFVIFDICWTFFVVRIRCIELWLQHCVQHGVDDRVWSTFVHRNINVFFDLSEIFYSFCEICRQWSHLSNTSLKLNEYINHKRNHYHHRTHPSYHSTHVTRIWEPSTCKHL